MVAVSALMIGSQARYRSYRSRDESIFGVSRCGSRCVRLCALGSAVASASASGGALKSDDYE